MGRGRVRMDYGCGRVVDDFEVVEEGDQWPTIA